MASWWKLVPWKAVAGQWGCTNGTQSVTFNPADENGVVSAGQGGVMHCGTALGSGDLSRVALPEARSVLEGESGILGTYCDFTGGTEDFCIRTSGTTMTASFQWFGTGTKTGRARLGLVGAGKPCAQGSQLALGTLGTGQYGAVWYASGMVNYNSYFSSSWLYTGGSLYGRWCALI